jgi:adenosylcobinamide-GDP ribazoletransferase
MKFIAAFRFLTVIPLPFRRQPAPEEVGRSVVFFPVVGLIIGLLLAGVYFVLDFFLPRTVTAALIMVGMVLINGALHIDGFIDTCDGLAGNKPAEERWKVMKDSRVGAFGVVGAGLLFLVQYASLISLPNNKVVYTALILLPVLSRWSMVYGIMAYPYAKPEGLGTLFKQYAKWSDFWIGTVITLVIAELAGWWMGLGFIYLAGLFIMAVVWLVNVCWSAYLNKKFAGLTGDSYGAVNEVSEVMILIAVIIMAYR